ncbi:hypothetical protein CKAH01_15882 [Colletotrichum kahawae]|uniref:Uncharacterized protein n=1 Tax=Colletotrichum kahawae TaxID=34407 RepID=A0AAD9YEX7_COLKA|nr:hypothetical protein CKAH01_15882 [Colletotrichum kahawae]
MQLFKKVDVYVVDFMREMHPVYDAEHDPKVRQLRGTMRQRWPVIENHFTWIFGFDVDGNFPGQQGVVNQPSYSITNSQPNSTVPRTADRRVSVAAPPFSMDDSLRKELDEWAFMMEKGLADANALAEAAFASNVNRGYLS